MIDIVKVKLKEAFPLHECHKGGLELRLNDRVVASLERGVVMGTVVRHMTIPAEIIPADAGRVLRIATEEDLAQEKVIMEKEREAHAFCTERAMERNLPLKLVLVEFLFDGSKAIFYFTAEGRIDFRELVKDLARQFRTRIEMRQIGVRDETRMVGGIGPCGRELCCSCFLKGFAPVSIRMAKDQGLTLDVDKLSGMCGRLKCCLTYEEPVYQGLMEGMPKCGKRVMAQCGSCKVMKLNVLKGMVTVKTPDGDLLDLKVDEIRPLN